MERNNQGANALIQDQIYIPKAIVEFVDNCDVIHPKVKWAAKDYLANVLFWKTADKMAAGKKGPFYHKVSSKIIKEHYGTVRLHKGQHPKSVFCEIHHALKDKGVIIEPVKNKAAPGMFSKRWGLSRWFVDEVLKKGKVYFKEVDSNERLKNAMMKRATMGEELLMRKKEECAGIKWVIECEEAIAKHNGMKYEPSLSSDKRLQTPFTRMNDEELGKIKFPGYENGNSYSDCSSTFFTLASIKLLSTQFNEWLQQKDVYECLSKRNGLSRQQNKANVCSWLCQLPKENGAIVVSDLTNVMIDNGFASDAKRLMGLKEANPFIFNDNLQEYERELREKVLCLFTKHQIPVVQKHDGFVYPSFWKGRVEDLLSEINKEYLYLNWKTKELNNPLGREGRGNHCMWSTISTVKHRKQQGLHKWSTINDGVVRIKLHKWSTVDYEDASYKCVPEDDHLEEVL